MTALTIQEAKEKIAIEFGFNYWAQSLSIIAGNRAGSEALDKLVDRISLLYAESKHLETCEAQKQICAINAKLQTMSCGDTRTCGCYGNCEHPFYSVNDKSILNAPNVEFKP